MSVLAVLALVLISSGASAATSERFGRGGWYRDFAPEIERANASGELFRIRGHCQSNCTLFLGLRNVCVERSATLLFHAGHDRQRNIHAGSTQRMLSAYNARLRKYVLDNHYMDTLEFHAIPGSMIIDRFGYRECPRE
jgi:hypothetical protein